MDSYFTLFTGLSAQFSISATLVFMPSKTLPPLKEMVSELIGTPSVSSTQMEFDQSNEAVIHLLAGWLEDAGFTISISPVESRRAGKFNLVARRGSGRGGLILSGHSDTVPFDEHLWQSDPFRVREADDRWYGLGSCDMKSFFALCLEALRPLGDTPLKAPLIVVATADEESSMNGARLLSAEDVMGAGCAIIGEPTNLRPVTRHKGIFMVKLRVEGTSGHSSNPALGNNAIEGMHGAIDELMRFRNHLSQTVVDPAFEVAFPTMNFGCIHGGDNPNRICDHAELAFDFRFLPSMDITGFTQDIQSSIEARIGPQGFSCHVEPMFPPVPAFENPDSALARRISRETGHTEEAVAFGTEAQFFRNFDLDTVVVGPGSINQAHQPDEYLPLSQINPATGLIRQLVSHYCL